MLFGGEWTNWIQSDPELTKIFKRFPEPASYKRCQGYLKGM